MVSTKRDSGRNGTSLKFARKSVPIIGRDIIETQKFHDMLRLRLKLICVRFTPNVLTRESFAAKSARSFGLCFSVSLSAGINEMSDPVSIRKYYSRIDVANVEEFRFC